MKIQKLIGFDVEVMKKLKKVKNASKLINEVMSDYFFLGINQKKEEVKANIVLLKREVLDKSEQIIALKETLKKIINKETELKSIFRDIPAEILLDFKEFPKMTEETLFKRFTDIYKKKFAKLDYARVLQAFKHQNEI